MQIDINNLSGTFLIAVPGLKDPNFERTVILICDHSKDGAFGLVINRILLNSFIPLLGGLEIKSSLVDMPVYYGGPVKPEQGYILYSEGEGTYYPSIKIGEHLSLTTAKSILADIAARRGPKQFLFALGFSGWAPGQLEYELMSDSWLVAHADSRIIFNLTAGDRWKAAAESIGIDLSRLINRQGRV
jgi:putative transcriptional regulator